MSKNMTAMLTTPRTGSHYIAGLKMPWEETDYEGFWLKRLYEDTERGEKTWLMRMDPGAHVGPHAHDDEFEQVFVLEGSFNDDNETLEPSDYACRAPGAIHGGYTEKGALILVIFSKLDPRD